MADNYIVKVTFIKRLGERKRQLLFVLLKLVIMNLHFILSKALVEGQCFYYFIVILLFNLVFIGPLSSYFDMSVVLWVGRALFLLYFIFFLNSNFHVAITNVNIFLVFTMCLITFLYTVFTPSMELRITAFKDYIIPVVSVFTVLYIKLNENKAVVVYKLLRFVSLVQFPFILQQYFFQAHNSISNRAFDWDLITGTFGFNYQGGGGNSAAFILFQTFFMTIVLSKMRDRGLEKLDYLAIVLIVITIMLSETKIFAVLLIFLIFSVFRISELVSLKRFVPLFISCGIMLSILFSFYNSNTSDSYTDDRTTAEYIGKLYEDYFEGDGINYVTGEVGRSAAIFLWYEAQELESWPLQSYFGYGLTSSKLSNSYIVESVTFGSYINIASSQAAIYLWDIGILGLVLFYVMLTYFMARVIHLRNSGSVGYLSYFDSGALFMLLSCLIYPLYSTTMHSSTITHSVMLVVLLFIFRVPRIKEV